MAISPITSTTPAANSAPKSSDIASKAAMAEFSKLAVSPTDSVQLSTQAQEMIQKQGIGSALAMLGG